METNNLFSQIPQSQDIFQNTQNQNNNQQQQIPNDQQSKTKSDKMIFMEKRREMYLKYQKNDRESILQKSRLLKFNLEGKQQQIQDQQDLQELQEKQKKEENLDNLFEEIDIKKTQPQQKKKYCEKKKSQNQYYADSLVQPEFMVDIPQDLYQNYYLLPRPNGQRCLVWIQDGYATCRDKNGVFFGKYNTQFKNNSILDCFYQKNQNIFYIMDAIQLGDVEVAQETTEFRLFMLQQQIEDYNIVYQKPKNEKLFTLVPFLECNTQNLRQQYCSQYPFIKEGMQFVHKQASYVGGMHPNFLIFKDKFCSMYPIEVAPDNQHNESLVYAVLQAIFPQNNNNNDSNQVLLQTLDKVTIASISTLEADVQNISDGDLIKCIFSKLSIQQCQNQSEQSLDNESYDIDTMEQENVQINQASFKQGVIQVETTDFKITGKSSHYKQYADPFSKLIFQYKIRNDPLQFDCLISSVENEQKMFQNNQQ